MSSVRPSVCPSVTLVDHDHIGWKSWKLIARTISPTHSLFVAKRSSIYSQGNMETFWRENVRSTPTSITSGWIDSTESHVILGVGVAVCILFTFVGALRGNLCDSTAFLLLLRPRTGAKYCDVCLFVCLFVRSHSSRCPMGGVFCVTVYHRIVRMNRSRNWLQRLRDATRHGVVGASSCILCVENFSSLKRRNGNLHEL